MTVPVIIPYATTENGAYLLVKENIGFASSDGSIGYNTQDTSYVDDIGNELPKVEDEVLILVALHFKYNSKEEEDPVTVKLERTTMVQRSYTPEDELEGMTYEDIAYGWKVDLSRDGWYRFHMFRVPVAYDPEGPWFDTTDNLLKKGDHAITDASLINEEDIASFEIDRFYYPNAQRAHDRAVRAKYMAMMEFQGYPPKVAEVKKREDMIDSLIAGAGEQFDEGNKYNAQRIIEFCNKYIRDERV